MEDVLLDKEIAIHEVEIDLDTCMTAKCSK